MSDARSLPSVGPAEARRLICAALGPSDLKPAYRDAAAAAVSRGQARDSMYGHCYVASQALYFSQGGYDSGWTVWQVRVPGEGSHWFLKNPEGDVVDPTASQFAPGAVPYDRAVKKAWVSQKSFPGPDKRTRRVLARAGLTRDGLARLDNPGYGSPLSPEDEAKRVAAREFAEEVKREMGLRRFSLAMSVPDGVAGAAPDLALLNFEVDRQNRSQGLGSAVMGRLTQYADDHGYRLVLNPAVRGYGGATSRGRLVAFYKRFGFRENKGRSKDFSIGFAMVRDPHAGLDAGHARDLARMDNPGGSDWRHFEKDLRRRGWRIDHTGGGHLKLYSPGGRHVVVTSSTPSDRRAFDNIKAQVRRAERAEGTERLDNPAKTIRSLPGAVAVWELPADVQSFGRGAMEIGVEIRARQGEGFAGGNALARVSAVRRDDDDAYRVYEAGAVHGWGPLAYDILMEMATKRGASLAPDPESVSVQAENIWWNYRYDRDDVDFVRESEDPRFEGDALFQKRPARVLAKIKSKGLLIDRSSRDEGERLNNPAAPVVQVAVTDPVARERACRKVNQGTHWIREDRRHALYLRDDYTCAYCRYRDKTRTGHMMSLDHLIPCDNGGTNVNENLVSACGSCNSTKGKMTKRAFYEYLVTVRMKTREFVQSIQSEIRRRIERRIDRKEGERFAQRAHAYRASQRALSP